ncbi:hypothetical protein KKF11_03620 [Patescibacteria group bacterium]|nr:hypothetical protein [Patescibacteria group bacterium]
MLTALFVLLAMALILGSILWGYEKKQQDRTACILVAAFLLCVALGMIIVGQQAEKDWQLIAGMLTAGTTGGLIVASYVLLPRR